MNLSIVWLYLIVQVDLMQSVTHAMHSDLGRVLAWYRLCLLMITLNYSHAVVIVLTFRLFDSFVTLQLIVLGPAYVALAIR